MTLDPDVERMIRSAMRERSESFKDTLNEAIRNGLAPQARRRSTRFVQKTFRMGSEQNFRWDKALALADALEDEEIGRKLSVRK